jgi:glycosyltransferase involved in cell wall biosynthesis
VKLLHINCTDGYGTRFTGIDLQSMLAERGIDSRHLVWWRESDNPNVAMAFPLLGRRFAKLVGKVEHLLGLQSLLHVQWLALPMTQEFRAADILHFHILQNGFFGLPALPLLTRRKPSIWTLHDPWAMTGHCNYPLDCTRWQTGCGACPRLDLPLAVRHDRTAMNFRIKEAIYRRMDIDVVVASRWMLDFARTSPLMKRFPIHHVPFGIDLERFAPRPSDAAKARLGIPPGRKVIAVRAADSPYKGFASFIEALRQLDYAEPLCVLTTYMSGFLGEFTGKHQIVELGWVDDDDLLADHYAAADFFVMPSTAEAFGLMAVEAMACGKPVLCFSGTSLPEVTFSPGAGLAVPQGDSAALAAAIKGWLERPDEVASRGYRSRRLAEEHYGMALHADRMTSLYREVAARAPRMVA